MPGRVVSFDELPGLVAAERAQGRTIVTTNGAFDLLHAGHRYLFSRCRNLADVLVVGVNSDSGVRTLKGTTRPIQRQEERARNVARYADLVFVFDDLAPNGWLRMVRPDVHATAETYGEECVEAPVLHDLGSGLALIPVKRRLGSTTRRLRWRGSKALLWKVSTVALGPALVIWARLRKRRAADRLLVVSFGALGDMVAATPFFAALGRSFPETEIHILGQPGAASWIARDPRVDRVFELRSARHRQLLRSLRRQRYRAAVIATRSEFATMTVLWAGVPLRIGRLPADEGRRAGLISAAMSTSVPLIPGTHTYDHWMALARRLGAQRVPYRLEFPVDDETRDRAARWMADRHLRPRSFVVVHPTAGNRIKEWPEDKWIELVDMMVERLDSDVAMVSQNAAAVGRICASVRTPERVIDGSMLSIDEVAVLSGHASCFVSVDSGPLYVAHASGAPLVVIVGLSHPGEQIPPAGPNVVHVAPPPGCAPRVLITDTKRSATAEQRRPITDTSVEAVFEAVASLVRASR